MRIHRNIAGGHAASVYLNGEKLLHCLVADDAEGWAACMFKDAAGRMVTTYLPEQDSEGEMITEILRGEVRLVFDPPEMREVAEAHLARIAAQHATWAGERG